jgi:hypothetical protein
MKSLEREKEKKGQITIFIILSIVIVVGILFFFFYLKPRFFSGGNGVLDFEGCVKQTVENKIKILGENGGIGKPEFFYSYQGNEYTYLCYAEKYFVPCVVQVPFLKQQFEKDLLLLSKEEIIACYDASADELRGKGYQIEDGKKDVAISILPKQVKVELDVPTFMEKGGIREKAQLNPIEVSIPLYEMLMISTSILQEETKNGDSDINVLMIYYPEFKIQKMRQGDETKLYSVEDKASGTVFQFASRSYAWAPGYGLTEEGIE